MTFLPQSLIDGPVGPNKDLVINGFMDVNQRGTTSLASNGHIFDRMQYANSGMNGGASAEVMSFPSSGFGQIPQNPSNYARISATGTGGTSGHFTLFRYKFPYGSRLANQLFTVEFYAMNSVAASIGVEGRLVADNGGTSDDIYGIDGKVYDLGSAAVWKRHRFLFNTPNWTPASIGGTERLELLLWLTTGPDFSAEDYYVGPQDLDFDIVNFGMFPGNLLHVPGDLKGLRDPDFELSRSHPYYWELPGNGTDCFASSSTGIRLDFLFPRRMARQPDVDLFGGTVSAILPNATIDAASPSLGAVTMSRDGGRITISGFSGLSAGTAGQFNQTNNVLKFDAEL